jgi:hypothetical protein
MQPVYVKEFERWHAAPAGEREQIAKHQIATFDVIGSLSPDLAALQNHPENVTMWNGKPGCDCNQDDFEAMAGWLRQLLTAARALSDAADLRHATPNLRI